MSFSFGAIEKKRLEEFQLKLIHDVTSQDLEAYFGPEINRQVYRGYVFDLLGHIAALKANFDLVSENATLDALREIDAQIPSSAKLPGTALLTDQMAHLLVKYNEQAETIARLEQEKSKFVVVTMTNAEFQTEAEKLVLKQVKRIKFLEMMLADTVDHLSNCVSDETDPEGIVMRIKSALAEEANDPG